MSALPWISESAQDEEEAFGMKSISSSIAKKWPKEMQNPVQSGPSSAESTKK